MSNKSESLIKYFKEPLKKALCRLWVSVMLVFLLAVIMYLTGCRLVSDDGKRISEIDYTVVENQDVPQELMKLIKDKKQNTLRLTYTTKEYTYLVAGYGTQPTSGYSIKVNDIYMGEKAIYADVSLIGPAQDESVNEIPTTPYVVIKIEKREEPVIFKM